MSVKKIVDATGKEVGTLLDLSEDGGLVEIKIGPGSYVVRLSKTGFFSARADTVYFAAGDCGGSAYIVTEDTEIEDAHGFIPNAAFVSQAEETRGLMYAPDLKTIPSNRSLPSRSSFEDLTCLANPGGFNALCLPLLPVANLNTLFQSPFHAE